jgi:hypothetical protein
LAVAQRLVNDAGFDAVVMGSLAKSREFDMGGRSPKAPDRGGTARSDSSLSDAYCINRPSWSALSR